MTTMRCVAFDFDGTLVDSNEIKQSAYLKVFQDIPGAAEILEDVLKTDYAHTRQAIVGRVANCLYPDTPGRAEALAGELVERYGALTEEMVATCPEIHGAMTVIDRLADKGYALALVSGTPTKVLADILEQRGWSRRFQYVLGAPAGKAENLNMLSRSSEIPCHRIVMVGDRETDRKGAADAGCRFIAFLRPDSDFETKPPLAVGRHDELDAMIEQCWAGDCGQKRTVK